MNPWSLGRHKGQGNNTRVVNSGTTTIVAGGSTIIPSLRLPGERIRPVALFPTDMAVTGFGEQYDTTIVTDMANTLDIFSEHSRNPILNDGFFTTIRNNNPFAPLTVEWVIETVNG